MNDPTSYRQVLIDFVGNGSLHRAIVSPPPHMAEPDQPERVVFFEAPFDNGKGAYLEKLLASAWCVDTAGWCESGLIYNIQSAADLRSDSSNRTGTPDDLQLFETGAGGNGLYALGHNRIHYARIDVVDLFVTPRVARRLRDALDTIELLYAEQARLRKDQ